MTKSPTPKRSKGKSKSQDVSSSKETVPDNESNRDQENVVEDHENDDQPGEESSSKGINKEPNASKQTRTRDLRRKRREQLRTRNMGLGIKIDVNKKGQKTTFDKEDDEDTDDDSKAEKTSNENNNESVEDQPDEKGEQESDDDDDDDQVEEVRGNLAREQALEQRARERETAVLQEMESKKKKRKRSVLAENDDDDDDDDEDLDEEFFAQLDSDLARQRKEKRKGKTKPIGKHTSFVPKDDGGNGNPIPANHNISLVVLGSEANQRALESKMGTKPSEAARFFSRSKLLNGDSIIRGNKSNQRRVRGWKRSKKMNRLLAASNPKQRRTAAAPHFVVHT